MIYDLLAKFYDRFNGDADYTAWGDYVEENFRRFCTQGRPELVLDLCCGTGKMTFELARRGYDMTGVDYSPEMLNVARETEEKLSLPHPVLWLCQDAREFELYGTVDACVCCLDSVNHLTGRGDLLKTFSLVHNYLIPDGLFLFDVNTKEKFSSVYGDRCYAFEEDGVFCSWQNDYRPKSGLCDFYITLFSEEADGSYTRQDEVQTERAYSLRQLRRALAECGFEFLGAYRNLSFEEGDDGDLRLYIAARCKKPAPALPNEIKSE